jgi:predicted RNA-binding protein
MNLRDILGDEKNFDPLFKLQFRDHNIIGFNKKLITLKHPFECDSNDDACRNHVIKFLKDEGYLDQCEDKVVIMDMYTDLYDENSEE